MKKLSLVILLLILISVPAFGILLSDYGLENYKVNVGARPLGMGGAFAGLANDENSAFYNPGGLPWSKGIMVFVKDQNNFAASQAYPTGFGQTYGIAVVRTSVASLQATPTQAINYSSNVLFLSASTKIGSIPYFESMPFGQSIGIGGNIKTLLGQSLQPIGSVDRTAQGWEADLGALIKPNPWFSIGVNVLNIMPTGKDIMSGGVVKWDTGELESVPASIKSGFSAKIIGDAKSPFYLEGNEVTVNMDATARREGPGVTNYGLEWAIRGSLFLRYGGYSANGIEDTSSFGAGIKFFGWGLDLTTYKDMLTKKSSFAFSVSYDPEDWVFEKKIVVETKKYKLLDIKDPITNLVPQDESTTYDDSVMVIGSVQPGLEVSVNGQKAAQDSNNFINTTVPLNPGKNLILIDIYNEDSKMTITRKVFKKPKVVIAEEKRIEADLKKTTDAKEKEKLKQDLSDLQDRKQKVEALVTMGVVEVEPRAEFKLEAPVTRAELANWLVKAANLPLPSVTKPVFSDVLQDDPQAPFIKAAVDYGLMRGIGDKFYPNSPVTQKDAQEIFKKFGVIKK